MSDEQQHLVSLLHSVHDKLRSTKRHAKDDLEWEQAWAAHTNDLITLKV